MKKKDYKSIKNDDNYFEIKNKKIKKDIKAQKSLFRKHHVFLNPDDKRVISFIETTLPMKIVLVFLFSILYPFSKFDKDILLDFKRALFLNYNNSPYNLINGNYEFDKKQYIEILKSLNLTEYLI